MPQRLYKILLILGIAAVIALVPAFWFWPVSTPKLEIDYLDVGQGDAILIKSPYGQNILIDGGPSKTVLRRLGENLPFWERTIDLMVLTHPHDDHVGGLVEVLKHYRVKRIAYTGVIHTSPNFISWLEAVKKEKIPLFIIDKAQVIELGPDVRLEALWPRENLANATAANLNNTCIVMRLDYASTRFLFTGDIEGDAEAELLKNEAGLGADVLKVAHHGSNYTTSEEFLTAVGAGTAVIMVGKDNKFGHPGLRTLKRLERAGTKVYRTDIGGTIKVISDGKEIRIRD